MQWQRPRGPVEQAASFFFDSSTQQDEEEVVGRLLVYKCFKARCLQLNSYYTILYYVGGWSRVMPRHKLGLRVRATHARWIRLHLSIIVQDSLLATFVLWST